KVTCPLYAKMSVTSRLAFHSTTEHLFEKSGRAMASAIECRHCWHQGRDKSQPRSVLIPKCRNQHLSFLLAPRRRDAFEVACAPRTPSARPRRATRSVEIY